MDKLTAEWCLREARFCRETSLAFRGADKRAGFGDGYERTAAALTIAARVLDEGAVDAVARAHFAEVCRCNGVEPNWGRSTVEQPRGYKTEIAVHHAAARAVLAYLKGEVE